jgi:hypothetical protein
MDTQASLESFPAGNPARCAFRHKKFIYFQASRGPHSCAVNHFLGMRIIKDFQGSVY